MGSIPGRDIPKSLKMVLAVPRLALRLVGYSSDRLRDRMIWLGVGHDMSVSQHYKSEHWAPCHNQTLLWYEWKITESDVKPEQTTSIFAKLPIFAYLSFFA